jgi:hypothetical protein
MEKERKLYNAQAFTFSSSAPRLIFGSSFQPLQATADVVHLKSCNDFVTPIT